MKPLFIVWSKEYETGIDILDEQYRGLVGLINSFFFHSDDAFGDIEKILIPTAEMFKSYAKINFLTVEKLMADSCYPDLEKYQTIHQEVLRNIDVMDRKCRSNRDAQGLLDYLKEYWIQTVQHNEIEYLDHLLKYFRER